MYHSKSILSENFSTAARENPEQKNEVLTDQIKGGSNCAFCQAVALCQPQSISASSPPNRLEAKQRLLKRGQILFKQGQPQDLLTVVCSGAIKSRMYNRNGEERVLGVTIVGETVGLDSLSKRKYTYDAIATTERLSGCPVRLGFPGRFVQDADGPDDTQQQDLEFSHGS